MINLTKNGYTPMIGYTINTGEQVDIEKTLWTY